MVAKPPYSPIFARGLAALLREPVVSKALRSSDLDAGHRRSLVAFVEAVAPSAKQAPMAEAEEEEEEEGGVAGALVTPTKGGTEEGEGMELDGAGNGNGVEEEQAKGPPPLLDAAMRKGLRLAYAQFLGKSAAVAAGGQGASDA